MKRKKRKRRLNIGQLTFILKDKLFLRLLRLLTEEVLWIECLCAPNIHMLKSYPHPQGDGVRTWGLGEVIRY